MNPVLIPAAIEITSGGLFFRGPRIDSTAFATSFGFTHRMTMSASAAAFAFSVSHGMPSSAATFSALAFVRAVARRPWGFTLPERRRPEAMLRPIVPEPMMAIFFWASMWNSFVAGQFTASPERDAVSRGGRERARRRAGSSAIG